MRRALPLLLMLLLLTAGPAAACFGPKLYLGTTDGVEADVLFALVSLYVKEKTGTEMVRVDLAGRAPLAQLQAEKVDLAFVREVSTAEPAVLRVSGLPRLVAGKRPLADLQFTTVVPALEKLDGLLQAEQVAALAAEVHGGVPAAAAVRRFLMEEGWI